MSNYFPFYLEPTKNTIYEIKNYNDFYYNTIFILPNESKKIKELKSLKYEQKIDFELTENIKPNSKKK